MHTHIQGSLKPKYGLLGARGTRISFPALHCILESVQAHGRNPGLPVGLDPSMGLREAAGSGETTVSQATFPEVALHPEQRVLLRSGPEVSGL